MQLTERQARLLQLWRSRCSEQRFPAPGDFDELALRTWLGDLHLLEVIDGGKDFRYLIYSTAFAQHLGRGMEGRLMSETPEPTLRAVGLSCYGEVVRRAAPFLVCRPTIIAGALRHDTVHNYLVLPLGQDPAIHRLIVLHDQLEKAPIRSRHIEYIPLDGGPSFSRSIRLVLRRAGVTGPVRATG
jgi:hypothetical protein